MSKKTGLKDLLEKASEKYAVPLPLLEKILDTERVGLYLFESSRSTVIENIRKMMQEETQKRE
jgi:hypothetical protein